MYYHIAPDLKLIFAWSPKCACTTVKTAVLMALGREFTGNVHSDVLTQENLKSGEYGIHSLSLYRKSVNIRLQDYLKLCIIRNPYSRYISGIRQRSRSLCEHDGFRWMTAGDYLEYMELNDYGVDHHFHPQTKNLKKFSFDRVFDVSEMELFFDVLKVEYKGQRFGKHVTTYGGGENLLHSASLLDLTKQNQFPESIHGWLDANGTAKLRTLYSADFDFARCHGYDYEL